MVSQWKTGERPVSLVHCGAIERETAGVVSVQELRPDVSWHRIPDASWPHPGGRPLVDVACVSVA
jgi:DNA-binding transcriptional regulator YdaS (Cro superfamily)